MTLAVSLIATAHAGLITIAGGRGSSGGLTAEQDFENRISGAGVVFFHGFDSVNEINAFRWTGGYSGGNDPLAVGDSLADEVKFVASGGASGGYMEILRPAGADETSNWWRPMSPMVGGTTTGNGRGVGQDDPGAGTITPVSYTATDGGGQISNWDEGWYGTDQTGGPWTYDGAEFWLQLRVLMDPRRVSGALSGEIDVGKLMILGRTDASFVDQKIVVYSGHPVSGGNYFAMYSENFGDAPLAQHSPGVSVHGNQPNTEYGSVGDGLCRFDNNGGRLANCWKYPDPEQWVTLMWHVEPGTDDGADTTIEVWMAECDETAFTKIWGQTNADIKFDINFPQGYNAIHLSAYINNLNADEFFIGFDELIFSHETIAAPQVPSC